MVPVEHIESGNPKKDPSEAQEFAVHELSAKGPA
jgi:hypothetical protein